MKIDFTLDFDALLKEAQAKRKECDDIINTWRHTYICTPEEMGYPERVKPILNEVREKWHSWVKQNITDRGLKLEEDMLGRPVAISAILAGCKA